MKLKVCGMNYNTAEVATLQPDYLGFIFWEPSSRYFQGDMPKLSTGIEKVGVFVNASIEEVVKRVNEFGLQLVQLHGGESPAFCSALQEAFTALENNVKIIKVFSVGTSFNFEQLSPFEEICDFYLFDTKGKLPGGNSYSFDWTLLRGYPSKKPFFLSGGIGPGDMESVRDFLQKPEAKNCHALDVNSRFETRPGEKNIADLIKFKGVLASGQ
ncbi:phosphoribosylanthranilate isomerase [Zeaxanthinibacter sp. PT1]|uniref:phosphoribosylanthranilate isomerase n=1 Tax=Zeaxanthinibacter TaxID=561554 RepID=UPI00234B00F3|nr:phosphoribosylanthranilate isomerase [Zeaxanthinibacter sp. PT1]MDC6351833.1 phosphoribosylanthranilate isomerase [Zeaxanthinibacter sp. PT1]